MFTVARRDQLRTQLLQRARDDQHIVGAAVTGSAAEGTEDRWSDIDLFLGVSADTEVNHALQDWSAFVYRELGALHHFDLGSGSTVYRAFLLADCLEIDLGLTPAAAFGPLGSGEFHLVFGEAADRQTGSADVPHLVGLCWHHVLHARTSIERRHLWQAEHWISALRDHVLTLACLRLGLPTAHAKGAHRLPADITGPLEETLVHTLDTAELTRALQAIATALTAELTVTAPVIAETLRGPFSDLAGPPASPGR